MRSLPWLPIAFLLTSAAAGQDATPVDGARSLAREHVAGATKVRLEFRVHAACDELLAADAAVRRRAGEYLHALLVEVAADARTQREGEESRAFWDRQRRANRLQLDLARLLADLPLRGDGAECEAALMWLWQHEESSDLEERGEQRACAAAALAAIRTPGVDRFFQTVVESGSTVTWALRHGLEQAGLRNLPVDAKAVLTLANHYQEGVRWWARWLADRRGIAVPEFEVEHSFGPALERLLAFVATLPAAEIPADATWVALHVPAAREGWAEQTWHGWLLQRGDASTPWRLLTANGRLLVAPLPNATIEPSTLAAFAGHLIAQRARYDASKEFDVKRAIEEEQGLRRFTSSSSDTWQGSPTELMVAAWSFARGDRATAAKLLLPLLAPAWDANEKLQPMLHEVAAGLDEAMLEAFVIAHYDEALATARKLAAPELAGFDKQERARELVAQLPARSEDFRALQLPSPAEWRAMRAEQPRAGQIGFLVERLRLLHCRQMSNPGGISYSQEQFATTQGGEPRAFDNRPAADERINPFFELLQLNLRADELPLLLPALETRDYVLAFDLARFLPQRPQSLHRVAWVAATICNEVAQEGLVDPRRFLGSDDERQAARQELVAWSKRNAGRTAADRLAERMREVEDWQEVRRAFWNLNTFDPVRAAATMRDVARARADVMPQVVRLFALLDRGEFVGDAREWVTAEDADQRFFAAVLLLRHRQEPEAALRTITERLAQPGGAEVAAGALEALLACELPAAKGLLRELLAGTHASGFRPSAAFVQRLLRAGWPEAHTALVDALAGKRRLRSRYGEDADTDAAPAARARQELLYEASTWWPDLDPAWPVPEAGAALDAAAAKVRQRLDGDWQRIGRNEAPTMKTAEPDLPWGDLLSYSTGWIRRM